jgi:hypothetical protein
MVSCYLPLVSILTIQDITDCLNIDNIEYHKNDHCNVNVLIDLDIVLEQRLCAILKQQNKKKKPIILFDYSLSFPETSDMPGVTINQYFTQMGITEFIDKHKSQRVVIEFRILYYDTKQLHEFGNYFDGEIISDNISNIDNIDNWIDLIIPQVQFSFFEKSIGEMTSEDRCRYHTSIFQLQKHLENSGFKIKTKNQILNSKIPENDILLSSNFPVPKKVNNISKSLTKKERRKLKAICEQFVDKEIELLIINLETPDSLF